MLFTKVLVAVAAAALAAAQDAVPSTCILECSRASAAQNNCSSFTDFQCVCSSAQFQLDARTCLQENCPDEVTAAVNIQLEQCGRLSISAVGEPTAANSLSVNIPTPSPTSPPAETPAASETPANNDNAGTATSVAWGAIAFGAAALAVAF